MQKDILQTWFFQQPANVVWEYLTRSELIEQWLTKTDFQPKVGHKFSFTDKSGKIIYCEVLEVKPFTHLSYSWQYASANDNKLFDSKVVWTLVPKEHGTELQLMHNGFAALEDYIAHNNGWNTCLKRFEEVLKTNQ
jgi:uncharacterized protein YndB with AHSA1/START domain